MMSIQPSPSDEGRAAELTLKIRVTHARILRSDVGAALQEWVA